MKIDLEKNTEIQWKLIGFLGKFIIDVIFRTAQIKRVGYNSVKSLMDSRKFIGASWHSRILAISYLHQDLRAAILVSRSKDGEIIARILKNQGHKAVRGSSRHGGRQALVQMIRKIKKGQAGGIIPDGPQGPRFKVQKGVIALAQKTEKPIIPITYSVKNAIFFKSWDKFMLPLPFTKCRVIYGRPIYVPKNINAHQFEDARMELETEMNRIVQQADRYFGRQTE